MSYTTDYDSETARMAAQTQPRTWTAEIEVRTPGGRKLVTASPMSQDDLLDTQTKVAVNYAARYLGDGDVTVTLYKTTKSHGTQVDRTFSVYEHQGKVRYQR